MSTSPGTDASSPPFIPIPGVANLRDVGGYAIPSLPSKVVRPGTFYRAADPCKCSEASIRQLCDTLGISTIYDLRSVPELNRNAGTDGDVPAFEGRLSQVSGSGAGGVIQREWVPVFKEEDYGPDQIAVRFRDYAAEGTEGFVRAYGAIAEHGAAAYARIFRQLASLRPDAAGAGAQGVLVHCTAGKDRTGVVVALLLSLLGVDDATIASEYTLTEVGLRELKPSFIERILASPAFQGPDAPGREGVLRMTTCTDEKMLDTLKMIRSVYGGAEGYVKTACGLSDDEIARIRSAMIVDREGSQAAL